MFLHILFLWLCPQQQSAIICNSLLAASNDRIDIQSTDLILTKRHHRDRPWMFKQLRCEICDDYWRSENKNYIQIRRISHSAHVCGDNGLIFNGKRFSNVPTCYAEQNWLSEKYYTSGRIIIVCGRMTVFESLSQDLWKIFRFVKLPSSKDFSSYDVVKITFKSSPW